MRIINLIDNISYHPEIKSEHGLSYYIETNNHKILFDTGQSASFIDNAKLLGVDLSLVDILVISHGHYDHGGGLNSFLNLNNHAKVYLNKDAFNDYYSTNSGTYHYIGLDKNLMMNPQIELIQSESYVIDKTLIIYSNINQVQLSPLGNSVLVEKRGLDIQEDSFRHEQNLIIKDGENTILMAGCAHNGILNIVEQITQRLQKNITHVFGGFHLYNLTKDEYETEERIKLLANELLKTKAIYYTGHCTGIHAYETLKRIMHDKIEYNQAGAVHII